MCPPFLANNWGFDPNDPNNKKNDPNAPQNISGVDGSFNQAPPGSDTAQPQDKKSSGQFTNLQTYLDANKQQASDMGNDITAKVEGDSQAALNKQSDLAGEKQTVQAVDPNAYLTNPDASKASEYQKLKTTGGYEGPDDLSKTQNYQAAQDATNKAWGEVDATKTEGGRKQLLVDKYQRPSYSTGQQNLDNVLVQNDEGTKQKFADLSQKYSGLNDMLSGTVNDVGNSINAAKTQAGSNKSNLIGAEKSAWDSLINPIQARATQMNTDNSKKITDWTNDAKANKFTDEELTALGLNAGDKNFGLDASQYLTPDQTQAGLNNAANSAERSRYAALNALIQDPTRNEITADGKAINPIQFNKEQYAKDLAARQAEFERNAKATNLSADAYSDLAWRPGRQDNYQAHSTATQNVWDFLNGLAPSGVVNEYGSDFNKYGVDTSKLNDIYSKNDATAKSSLTNMLNAWIDQQNYNKTIGKKV